MDASFEVSDPRAGRPWFRLYTRLVFPISYLPMDASFDVGNLGDWLSISVCRAKSYVLLGIRSD